MFDITSGVVALLGIPQQFYPDAALAGASDLTVSATHVHVAQASLSGESDLTATGIEIASCSATLSAESDLTAVGTEIAGGIAVMSAESDLTAAATRVQPASCSMSSSSDLAASAVRVQPAAASLSGESDLFAEIGLIIQAASSLSAESDLTADAVNVLVGSTVSMSAEATLAPVSILPIYRLIPQTYEQVYTDNILMGRFGIDTGKTILINDNIVTITDYVYQQEFEEADYAFQGGRKYQLTQDQYDAFVNAGRADLVEVA